MMGQELVALVESMRRIRVFPFLIFFRLRAVSRSLPAMTFRSKGND